MAGFMKIGLLLLLHFTGCSASCDAYDIQSCQSTSGLTSYMRSQGIDITSEHAMENSLLFTLNKTQLQHYCSLIDLYNDCINEDVFLYCDVNLRLLLTGVRHGTTYICKDTLTEYLDVHHECLQDATLRDQLKQCVERTKAEMEADTSISQICSDGLESERCQVNAVQRQCGLQTSQWYRGLVNKFDKPLFDHIGCEVYHGQDDTVYSEQDGKAYIGKSGKGKRFPLWAVGLVITVVIVLLVFSVAVCRRLGMHTTSDTVPSELVTAENNNEDRSVHQQQVVVPDKDKLILV